MILHQFLKELKVMQLSPIIHYWAPIRQSRKDLEHNFWSWAITKWCSVLKAVHGWATEEWAQHLGRCMAEPQKNVLNT